MKKMAEIYAILLGICIIGLWIMLFSTEGIPELKLEPIAIGFHIIAEVTMGLLLIISGIGLMKNWKAAVGIFTVANGMVIYSVINSAGYYGQNGQWQMVFIFVAIFLLSLFLAYGTLKGHK